MTQMLNWNAQVLLIKHLMTAGGRTPLNRKRPLTELHSGRRSQKVICCIVIYTHKKAAHCIMESDRNETILAKQKHIFCWWIMNCVSFGFSCVCYSSLYGAFIVLPTTQSIFNYKLHRQCFYFVIYLSSIDGQFRITNEPNMLW